jgi:hypothetical protein
MHSVEASSLAVRQLFSPQYQLVREIVAGVAKSKPSASGRGSQDISDFSFRRVQSSQPVHLETRAVADHCHAQVDPRNHSGIAPFHIRCTGRSLTSHPIETPVQV